jgi:hypothetical protein
MGIAERPAFVDRELLVITFLLDEERDHFRRSAEKNKSTVSKKFDSTYEKFGPGGSLAF